jgi:hypothetical protein
MSAKKKVTQKEILAYTFSDGFPHVSVRYERVYPILAEADLLLPEIDIIRMEICSCYIIGAYTACITLTNHLLEKYCKELLIIVDFGASFLRIPDFDGTPLPDLSIHLNKDLSDSLRACKTKGLLSKADWKQLDKYRDIFRNGFGHYTPAKILQDRTLTVGQLPNNDKPETDIEYKLHETPFAGAAIAVFAAQNAWPYLATVENFIRSTIRYFHNPRIDPGLPTLPLD